MSDLIRLVDLEVWSRIGVPDEERALPQRLLLCVEMRVASFVRAAADEDLSLTVNYVEISEYIRNFSTERPRKLLETFAEELSAGLLNTFPIKRLRLEVKKFVLPNTAHVAVEIERKARKVKAHSREI